MSSGIKNIKTKESAFKFLRRKLEAKGIIVMQSGVVGSDNRRRLDVNEFRGFYYMMTSHHLYS